MDGPLHVPIGGQGEIIERLDLNSEFPYIITTADAERLKTEGFDSVLIGSNVSSMI